MQKPDYDIYIDDKSYNVDSYIPVPKENNLTKKNNSFYCTKRLG